MPDRVRRGETGLARRVDGDPKGLHLSDSSTLSAAQRQRLRRAGCTKQSPLTNKRNSTNKLSDTSDMFFHRDRWISDRHEQPLFGYPGHLLLISIDPTNSIFRVFEPAPALGWLCTQIGRWRIESLPHTPLGVRLAFSWPSQPSAPSFDSADP